MKQDRTGFFSLQNSPVISDAVLLLAFGPKLDPVALELYYFTEGNKRWVQVMRHMAKHMRWRYPPDFQSVMMIEHTVKQVTFKLPIEAFFDGKLTTNLYYNKCINKPNDWMNG